MVKRQNGIEVKYIVSALLVLLITLITIICGGGVGGAYAAAVDYSGVIQDLEKDENFNPEDYPQNNKDYSLQVIQIAESTDNKLFLYVYNPCGVTRPLIATFVNMSLTQSVDNTRLYNLTYVSSNGVFGKYLVNGVTVSEESTRYYNITSIYRKWIKGIDEETGNDNTINEVAFGVGKVYCASTVNSNVVYSERHLETVEIVHKYQGYIRYNNGFFLWGNSSCDSHYLAFSTDWNIELLFEADVEFTYCTKYTVSNYHNPFATPEVSFGKSEEKVAHLNCDETAKNPAHGLFGKEYTWQRIESVEKFKNDSQNGLSESVKSNLDGCQWVLRYYESPFVSLNIGDESRITETFVNSVAVLRLKFVTDGVTYNLGVVDDKQTGGLAPSNTNTKENDPWGWLLRTLGIPEWLLILLIVVIKLAILLPVLSIIFPVFGQILKVVFKCIWWVICLPFRGIAWVCKKIFKRE